MSKLNLLTIVLAIGILSAGTVATAAIPTPGISEAYSCRDHAGTEYCLDLFFNNIEPRIYGVTDLKVVLSVPVTYVDASVSCNQSYGGTVDVTYDADPNTIRVGFSPKLPDVDCCEVFLSGGEVEDSFLVAPLGGDVNRDGQVSTADGSSVKGRLEAPVTELNFWYDVNADGQISTADRSSVKARLDTLGPECGEALLLGTYEDTYTDSIPDAVRSAPTGRLRR